jgi:hypothetical protein
MERPPFDSEESDFGTLDYDVGLDPDLVGKFTEEEVDDYIQSFYSSEEVSPNHVSSMHLSTPVVSSFVSNQSDNCHVHHHVPHSKQGDDDQHPLVTGDDIYQQCVHDSLNQLRTLPRRIHPFTERDLMKFESSDNTPSMRCRIGKKVVAFHIFPWFQYQFIHFSLDRIRETLENQQKVDQIVEAMNFFWSRNYDDMDLLQLHQIYIQMENERDKKKNAVSRILDVYRIFKQYCDEMSIILNMKSSATPPPPSAPRSAPKIPTSHIDPLKSLDERVGNLENYVGINDHISPGPKRPRVGGDRACWWKIRKADYRSRVEWCTPGSVFGLYSDGVGPLRPKRSLSTWVQVVVYSAAPDTEEEHPNPQQYDRYVLVVMVSCPFVFHSPPSSDPNSITQIGEAPVLLRSNQIEKLKRLQSICHLYVNKEGEVNVRSIDKGPPTGGVVFGTTQWNENAPRDSVDGYPMFQGVRGVCAKISPATLPNASPSLISLLGCVTGSRSTST